MTIKKISLFWILLVGLLSVAAQVFTYYYRFGVLNTDASTIEYLLFFLSGALYPLQGLPGALKVVVTVNPLSYGVDGMRGALIGVSHFGVPWDLGVLAVVAAIFMVLGAWSFSKIEL